MQAKRSETDIPEGDLSLLVLQSESAAEPQTGRRVGEVDDGVSIKPDLNAWSLAADHISVPGTCDGWNIGSGVASDETSGAVGWVVVADIEFVGVECGVGGVVCSAEKNAAVASGRQPKFTAELEVVEIVGCEQEVGVAGIGGDLAIFDLPAAVWGLLPAEE